VPFVTLAKKSSAKEKLESNAPTSATLKKYFWHFYSITLKIFISIHFSINF